MGAIEAVRAQAERLQLRQLAEDELPDWWWEGVTWGGPRPTVLVSQTGTSLELEGRQLAGVALRYTNEIAIFSGDFDIVLAHETAHFCQPAAYSSHGPMFLNQFANLLLFAGYSLLETERELRDCVMQNWWPLAPQWLMRRAIEEALRGGGDLGKYESGLIRLCSIRHPGWRLALPATAAMGAGAFGAFFGGPLAAAAASLAAAGLLLMI